MNEVCRLCLQPQPAMSPIFSKDNESSELWLQILDCCSVEVLKTDTLPKLICDCCKTKLVSVSEFRKQCQESDLKLRQYYQVNASQCFIKTRNVHKQDVHVQTEFVQLPLATTQTSFTNNNEESDDEKLLPVKCFNGDTNCANHKECEVNIKDSIAKEQNALKEKLSIVNIEETHQDQNHKRDTPNNNIIRKETYSCNICGKVYASKKTLAKHAKCHMNSDGLTPAPNVSILPAKDHVNCNKDLKCNVCNMPFTEQAKLNAHLRMHGIGLPVKTEVQYLCDICSKTFVSNSGLRFHLKSHNGSKPHLCRYCNKSFVIPSYKNRHEKTHTGDKRFICHICSAAFASSNGLKYHLRTHTGEANYHCKTCGKSFRRYKYLKEHTFTHTGERPFACKICGLAYGNSGSLFVHEKKCKSRLARVPENPIKAEQRAGGTEKVSEEVRS